MGLNELGLSEAPSLEVFEDIGYSYEPELHKTEERISLSDVVLRKELRQAIQRLNPDLPEHVVEQVFNRFRDQTSPEIIENNKDFYELLTEGVSVEYKRDGEKIGDRAQIIDFDDYRNNKFTVTNQYPVQIGDNTRRIPDIVAFINGLPLIVIEAKDPTNEEATIQKAYKQVAKKYPKDIPDFFRFAHFIAAIDLQKAKVGTTNTPWEWYSHWNYVEEEGDTRPEMPPSERLIRGAFHPERALDLIKNYTLFEEDRGDTVKKLAQYHQYYAVEKAVERTLSIVPDDKENRIGTVFHTQGSGKSLSMVFYVKKVRRLKDMKNPTFVLITDRTALDDQLVDQFNSAGFKTDQASSVEDVREKVDRAKGGIIFTLIHKFQTQDEENTHPVLNERQDVIVMADEAHRTQYSSLAENLRKYALPNASYLGFTATPIEKEKRSTYAAFGEEISTYTIQQSEEEGSTVRIIYESRMAKLRVNTDEVAERTRELLQGESDELKEKMKGKWKRLSKIIENSEERIELVCDDIVSHFNERQQKIDGKALVVCISREAAYKYQQRIQANSIAPESCLVISDKEHYVDNPEPENKLKQRFQDPDDPLKIAVVCGKWTTGFDVPSLHTLYLDRPMKNHNLMQTIGRVNRVYKDKPGGLIVDYIGIGEHLKDALDKYTAETQQQALQHIDKAIDQLYDYYEKVKAHLEPIDYQSWIDERGIQLQRLAQQALNHVLQSHEREKAFKEDMNALKKAYNLVSPHQKALDIQEEVVFFQAVLNLIRKAEDTGKEHPGDNDDVDSAMKDIVSEEINADELVTIVGIEKEGRKPVLSEDFLDNVKNKEVNVQRKLLESLIRNEISAKKQQSLAKYESFEKELEKTISDYHNNHLTTEEVVRQLHETAKDIYVYQEEAKEGDLDKEERAFYDALLKKDVKDVSDEELKDVACQVKEALVETENLDWTKEGNEKKKSAMRRKLKSILREEGFSPKEYKPLVEPIMAQATRFYEAKHAS